MCVKYRKQLLKSNKYIEKLKHTICEISKRYWFEIEEMGTDGDHVHLFVGAAPRYAPSKIMQILKSISARQMFQSCSEIKLELWGGEFWSDGGYIGTVSDQTNAEVVKKYIREQGDHQEKIQSNQLGLFKI